jgi:acyl-CoA synthetase (AMP-forming)/AMP-acid ligase II
MAADERWAVGQVPVAPRDRFLPEGGWTDETLGVVDDFPRTASGKVRKVALRRRLRGDDR